MHNAADRKSIRRAEKEAALAERQRAEVTTNIMSTAAGRRWIWDRLAACGIFTTTFVASAPDVSAFNEGQRSMGLALLADIMASCPDQFIHAMREANVRSTIDERRRSAELNGGDLGSEPSDDSATGFYDEHGIPHGPEDRGLDDGPINWQDDRNR
jgi:hypothetical protein